MNVLGKDLKIGDVIEVWWKPNRDTIIGLKEYTGGISNLWKDGARLADFAQNRCGMTIDNGALYKVVNR